jgi:hypothetical protein
MDQFIGLGHQPPALETIMPKVEILTSVVQLTGADQIDTMFLREIEERKAKHEES